MSNDISVDSTKKKKPALGRGLGSLLGGGPAFDAPQTTASVVPAPSKNIESAEPAPPQVSGPAAAPAAVPPQARIWLVPIEKVSPNREQPRKVFDSEELKSLSQSIKEKGVIQPLIVRKLLDGQFQIVAGERRWRAAQLAGLHEVPVIIRESTDQETLEIALIENIQRQDLNALEEAEAYQYLISKYHLTQEALAKRVGKERATIANMLRVLNLSPDVREMVSSGEISLGQAKALLTVNEPLAQKKLALKVKQLSLSVRATERLVSRFVQQQNEEVPDNEHLNKTVHIKRLCDSLQKVLGTKVNIDYFSGQGKIQIHFYSDDELNALVEKVEAGWKK